MATEPLVERASQSAEPAAETARSDVETFGPARYLNRELSWLEFAARLLDIAGDETLPLLERAKFLAIFSTGLDEFFQVRVAGLKNQLDAGRRGRFPDGRSVLETLEAVRGRVTSLVDRQARIFNDSVRPGLSAAGIEIVEGDAAAFPLAAGAWDAALCLGASFVWHGLDGTLAALAPAVRPGGHVVVGEPYWRSWPLPEGIDDLGYLPLRPTVAKLEAAGLPLVTLIASSEDDWDTYESLHWRALEGWLAENPDDPDAVSIRARHEAQRDEYLRYERALFGWAIFAGLKP